MPAAVTRKRKQTTEDFTSTANTRTKRSRKLADVAVKQENEIKPAATHVTEAVKVEKENLEQAPQRNKTAKRQRSPEGARTPQNKRFKDAIPPTPSETPTRGASRLFDRLNLAPIPPPETASKEVQAYSSPPVTPQSKSGANLPPAVDDAIQLFAAFHSAWSLFIAHNGGSTPIHVIEMLARATATWKKRRVTLDDVRRLLGVLGECSPFVIIDNGDGDLCLELKSDEGMATILQTKKLVHQFEHLIRKQWHDWCSSGSQGDARGEAFLKTLPLATATKSEVAADPTRLTKGAARLQSLKAKAPASAADISSKKIAPVAAEAKTSSAIASRGASLIDRIMAKEALAASRDSGPTREELERASALDRIEEVILVLNLLAGGRPRASFSMQMLVQHLRNSARNPIAKEEAEQCVLLMAKEVCPRFVGLVQSGGLNVVVITKAGRPSTAELKDRVDQARKTLV